MRGPETCRRSACFCVSPQLTSVHTKLIANGLFAKCSQKVDLQGALRSQRTSPTGSKPPHFLSLAPIV